MYIVFRGVIVNIPDFFLPTLTLSATCHTLFRSTCTALVSFRCPRSVFTHPLCLCPSSCLTSYFFVLVRFCNNLNPACSFFLLLVAVESPRLNTFTAERFCSAPRSTDRLATPLPKWVILSLTPLSIADRIYMCP